MNMMCTEQNRYYNCNKQERKHYQNSRNKTSNPVTSLSFKGSVQWELRGVGEITNVRYWYRTVAIEVNFFSNFAVVFSLLLNPFPLSKAQVIGNKAIPLSVGNALRLALPVFPQLGTKIHLYITCTVYCTALRGLTMRSHRQNRWRLLVYMRATCGLSCLALYLPRYNSSS